MKTAYTQNNFLSYVLILASFFVILFFTKNIYTNLQVNIDEGEQKMSELNEKNEMLTRLNTLEKELSSEGSEAAADIQGFLGEFSDESLVEYLYSYAANANSEGQKIVIKNVSISS